MSFAKVFFINPRMQQETFLCFLTNCAWNLSLRDAGADGSEEASSGGEATRWGQSGGLHPHHCPNCCEWEETVANILELPDPAQPVLLLLSGADGDPVGVGGSVQMGSMQHLLHSEWSGSSSGRGRWEFVWLFVWASCWFLHLPFLPFRFGHTMLFQAFVSAGIKRALSPSRFQRVCMEGRIGRRLLVVHWSVCQCGRLAAQHGTNSLFNALMAPAVFSLALPFWPPFHSIRSWMTVATWRTGSIKNTPTCSRRSRAL